MNGSVERLHKWIAVVVAIVSLGVATGGYIVTQSIQGNMIIENRTDINGLKGDIAEIKTDVAVTRTIVEEMRQNEN